MRIPLTAVPGKILALSNGVARTMFLTTSKYALLLVMALGVLGAGTLGSKALAGPATPTEGDIPTSEDPTRVTPPDVRGEGLIGEWVMTLPAGFTYPVQVRRLSPTRYMLAKAVRFSGEYELRADRLVLVKPTDPAEGGFEWQVRGDGVWALVEQRPVAKLGSDYRGATLTRPQQAPRGKNPPNPKVGRVPAEEGARR